MLAREPEYAERAAKIAGMARDVTEFLGSYDMGPPKRWSSLRVALPLGLLHAARPAHHRRAAQAAAQRRLHRGRGAGGPSVLRLGRHLQHPAAGRSPPSCATARSTTSSACARTSSPPATSAASRSSASGMDIPIAHTVELLDWAYGGPMPRGLEALAKHVQGRARGQAARSRVTLTCVDTGPSGADPENGHMRIGVPKEIKVHEYRVGMTPAQRARGGRARPRGARGARRRRAPGLHRQGLRAGRRQGARPRPPRSSPRPT